jgi:hypothetical protein
LHRHRLLIVAAVKDATGRQLAYIYSRIDLNIRTDRMYFAYLFILRL